MRSGRPRNVAPCLLVSLTMLAPEAHAYLDPSTGSMILSAIVGMFATAALAVKTYWYKLKGLFRRPEQAPRDPDNSGRDGEPRPGSRPGPD